MPRRNRGEQLRNAKRRQREKERSEGLFLHQLRLPAHLIKKLQAGMKERGFVDRFHEFLNHEMIEVSDFANLNMLCWNRHNRYLSRKDAFDIYERNWRHVEESRMAAAERHLLHELTVEYGKGVLNV
jgi:hypothetical protein